MKTLNMKKTLHNIEMYRKNTLKRRFRKGDKISLLDLGLTADSDTVNAQLLRSLLELMEVKELEYEILYNDGTFLRLFNDNLDYVLRLNL